MSHNWVLCDIIAILFIYIYYNKFDISINLKKFESMEIVTVGRSEQCQSQHWSKSKNTSSMKYNK